MVSPSMPLPTDAPLSPAEEAARWLSEERVHFDQLVASVEDYAIFMISVDGFILDWNCGAARLKGYTAEEIVGQHFSRLYLPEDLALDLPGQELVIARETGKFSVEGWRLRKDGTSFWATVTITAVRAASGELAGFLKITRDLTERKMAEETLRESEERMRLLIESLQDYAIFLLDLEGHVMSWNSGARRIKQYEESEIVGTHFSVFYPPEARAAGLPAALLEEALRNGRAEDEGWRVRKDGTTFWGNVVITALENGNPALRGFVKVTRDLTGTRQIEMLRETGKRKDVFLATLAHELRNPLSPLLAAVEIIEKRAEEPAIVLRMGEILKTQVTHMTRLIDDLLDMARITSAKITLQKQSVPLADIVAMALETVGPDLLQRQHALVCEGLDEPVLLDADPFRLAQILTNLLSNAAKYTPRGGNIVLAVSRGDDDTVEISVKDNGIGIPPVLHVSIFEMFDQGATASAEGLGIGLTLVKSLTELHGGTVSVCSAGDGCGSEFTIRLPVREGNGGALIRLVSPTPPSSPSDTGGRILVADDNRSGADTLALLLETEGYQVAVAYDGQEALDLAKTFLPGFAFLDLGMPRMGGLEAARAIRRVIPGIVLAALTGWGTAKDRHETTEAGFDFHLVKPAKLEEIRSALESLTLLPDVSSG